MYMKGILLGLHRGRKAEVERKERKREGEKYSLSPL